MRRNFLQTYVAWFIATLFVIFQFFLQTASSVLSNSWTVDFSLNKVELGNLSAAFFYSYVFMQIPVGIVYDRFRVKNVLVCAAALLSSGCFILAMAQSYELAMLARVLMGVGSSFGFIGMLKIIIDNFKVNEFAFMLGLSESIGMIVITFGIILLAYFLKSYALAALEAFSEYIK